MNPNRNNESNLPQKYVNFKRRTRNYRKRLPTISFIPLRVNVFSASGITAGFIPITEVSTGISKSPIIRLIHFQLKSFELISTMRFRYGICMCIGIRIGDNLCPTISDVNLLIIFIDNFLSVWFHNHIRNLLQTFILT